MLFTKTKLPEAYILDIDKKTDDRGFFGRAFCQQAFQDAGLNARIAQINLCANKLKGTLRGLHYQIPPAAETKLVRCTQGAIYDVIVDLRSESPTYLQYEGFNLTADNYRALYVPAGFAHGYQTLTDNAEIMYFVSEFYTPDCERGIRFDDPKIGIQWPLPISLISEKDRHWPDLTTLSRDNFE